MRNYEEVCKRRLSKYGAFDDSNLAKDFIPYFESGQRVKVKWSYGEELTGTIGITTGRKPVFLLMRTSRSIGSPYVIYKDDCKIIAVKNGRTYEKV